MIIIRDPKNPDFIETFTALTKLCKAYGWKYHTLKEKKFPFNYKGYRLDKIK